MVQITNSDRGATPGENLRGSLLMALAMAGFGINDIIVKYLSTSFELGQIIFVRGLFATFFIAILAWKTGKASQLKTLLQPEMWLRAIAEILATITFLIALFNMPIANTSAIMQALPMVVTLGAVIFFGEKIGWHRIAAIIIGFLGVLMIIKPGMEGFSIYSIMVIGTVFFTTIRDLTTRLISKQISTLFIALFTSVLVTMTGAVLCLFETWKDIGINSIAFLALAAGCLVIAYSCIAGSMRVGDISAIVPFRYTILIYSIVAGVMFFDEIPDMATIIGSIIIVVTGIYIFNRERKGLENR